MVFRYTHVRSFDSMLGDHFKRAANGISWTINLTVKLKGGTLPYLNLNLIIRNQIYENRPPFFNMTGDIKFTMETPVYYGVFGSLV